MLSIIKFRSNADFHKHGVAGSDTYQDDMSDGYSIRDRISYGWHRIPG